MFTDRVKATLADQPTVVDSRKWSLPAHEAMGQEVSRLLTQYRAA